MKTDVALLTTPPQPVSFGAFVLDAEQARLSRGGVPVALSGRPLALLALLAANPERLLSKEALLDAVWGHRYLSDSVLKGAINTVRAALEDDVRQPRYIETVPRLGYRFVAAVAAVPATAVRPLLAGAAEVLDRAGLPADEPPDEPPDAGPAARGNLPPAQPGLVGREADLAQLLDALQRQRLVTLTGLAGVGKTRLALAALHALRTEGWWVRLDDIHDPALLVPTVAHTLHLGPGADADAAALARALQPSPPVLLLDNAEHLVDAVAQLAAELLATVPRLRLLVTSQLPLRLASEQVLPLQPLALPPAAEGAAAPPDSYAAARLFCEKVRQQQPGWLPRPDQHAPIAAICGALDGLPLALELAASRVPLLGVAGVQARLGQRFALLTRAPRDAHQRHRTLVAAMDWTFALLSGAEQQALQRLAVFLGSFTAEAAEAVLEGSAATAAEPALDLIEALRERSLLVLEPGHGVPRLRLFDSVRRYALERLAAAGDEAAARRQHLAWTRRCFEGLELVDFNTPLLHWLPAARLETESLRAALRHGLRETATAEEREDALRLLAASAIFWYRCGLRGEGLSWLQAGAAWPAEPQTRVLLDHALGVFGSLAQNMPVAKALEALRRARPALVAQRDRWRCYLSLYAEHFLCNRINPDFDSGPLIAEMHATVEPHWGQIERRYVRTIEANACRRRGEYEAYVAICAQLAASCRAAGALAESWPQDNGHAQGLVVLGRLDEACALLDRTLLEIRAAGQLRLQVTLLAIAASARLFRDGSDAARSLGLEAVQLLQTEGMVWWMADALPWAAWHDGRPADAARLQAWADALVHRRGDSRGPFFRTLREATWRACAAHARAAELLALLEAPTDLSQDAAIALALGAHAPGQAETLPAADRAWHPA